ncbi:efflux RND transporter permease subunit [Marivivens donghaensis]|uniref:Efflux RND transporter permease subunit n=1 Tax=Marivivens donghaensis TaxID=1699413 RepID=A0ABX0W0Y0_9RHOB|nr:efflux RND transporter permease subunit [Marivivens donghaensis]NIY73067.1 efflux RND transporter permease subunit [Marivivens donghaensis]
MTGMIDWAASRARMVILFILLSIVAGWGAYTSLPKEGEPDIEIPALFVSVPFPGISAADSETLLVKPMETELGDLDGLKKMTSNAAEGYAGVALEFEFGWDKTKTMADVRDAMNSVEGKFPAGADNYSINEINFSEFPIIIVSLTGNVPERTLINVAKDLQEEVEGIDAVLSADLSGQRDEMLEVEIDPLRLEAYNVTAGELINVVTQNNLLIAAGEVETDQGNFAVKIPSSFDTPSDIYDLPVKTNGDRVVTLGDLATIRLTFEDAESTARFNGVKTVALQVVKARGYNLIDTATLIRETVEEARANWPEDLRTAIQVSTSNDQSRTVDSMVKQLEGSVLTAIALVMIVVLASLGTRSALLVGFSIPTSFLLTFLLLGAMDVTISNIVMFGLILAVGMLVDGAIVVVEYADKRIDEGVGPMHAYTEAAKRMFWPVISSTATTLCAFLPMLFWPGVPGQFMGMLPVTLIFVLSASLVVALIFMPVLGGVLGRISRSFGHASDRLRKLPWIVRAVMWLVAVAVMLGGALSAVNPAPIGQNSFMLGFLIFCVASAAMSITMGSLKYQRKAKRVDTSYRRSPFGWFMWAITNNPVMPIVTIVAIIGFVVVVFDYFGKNNNGVEFFTETEPEQSIVYVQARGNLSLAEKDALVAQAEDIALSTPGIESVFAFSGAGGLNANTAGAESPRDAIGQLQLELIPWDDRPAYAIANDIPLEELDGNAVMANLQSRLDQLPGIRTETLSLAMGPASAKPVNLRLKSDDWDDLLSATAAARAHMETMPALTQIEDSRPLPGIDWEINVDVEKAGRYGADVATVGAMVQLVTRGILLDTMRVDSSDEEIEIRVRLPEEDRVLATLDSLKVRTQNGLVPLSNFITRQPVPKLAQIDRIDQKRYFDLKAGVTDGMVVLTNVETEEKTYIAEDALTAEQQRMIDRGELTRAVVNGNERITALEEWLLADGNLPASVSFEWAGDMADQEESQAFLQTAFAGALVLMFIILLAQFNSFYNSVLVLLAVILSTAGVLVGMLVMDQAFSIIMTGTGIVALAGIVVNNNIVLIDTYQEYTRYMPKLEAIVRTAQDRIRPVLLTTITTMAGLAPMMFGLSLDFINGGYSIDSPTALWWKQLATAVVFGLGIATVLTLIFTPAMLALRVWVVRALAAIFARSGQRSRLARSLRKWAKDEASTDLIWTDPPAAFSTPKPHLRAAE